MARCRALFLLALAFCASLSFATDYRLVVASDDPSTRQAASLVVYEGTGKLNKEDRITSITFSAQAEVKPNCLVSLDPASGKASLALSPDVEVYKGKVLIAGAKPTKKVIPAHIEVDVPVASTKDAGKLGSVMQPIMQQVNNLPWVYIGTGIGIFMLVMFVMNRRSYQYSTSMSKEAKNLYLETVGRITERLDNIETSQRNLVKNPPVVRTFRAQIEDFEGRLNRIEKLAKESHDDITSACNELAKGGERYQNITIKLDESKAESAKISGSLKQESDALRSEMKLMLKSQDEANASLTKLDDLGEASKQFAGYIKDLEAKVTEQGKELAKAEAESLEQLKALIAHHEEALAKAQAESLEKLAALNAELQTLRANQESLMAMPQQLELVTAGMTSEFNSVRESMPRLDAWEDRFSGFQGQLSEVDSKLGQLPELSSKLDRLPEISTKLDALPELDAKLSGLPEIKNAIESIPNYHNDLEQIHDSILKQIEGIGSKVEESGAGLGELINAHSFTAPVQIVETEAKVDEAVLDESEAPVAAESKKSKKSKSSKKAEAEVAESEEPVALAEPELVDEPNAELEAAMVEEEPVAELEATELEADLVSDEPVAELESSPKAELEEIAPEAVLEVLEPEVAEDAAAELAVEEFEPEAALEPETEVEVAEMVAEVEVVEALEEVSLAEAEIIEAEAEAAEVEPEAVAEEPPMLSMDAFIEAPEAVEQIEEPVAEVSEPVAEFDAAPEAETSTEEVADNFKPGERMAYRYAEDAPVVTEFHFNNAIKKLVSEEPPAEHVAPEVKAAPVVPGTFHLDLPDHLETFEDDDTEAPVLSTLKVVEGGSKPDPEGEAKAVESVLKKLESKKPEAELEAFDNEQDAEPEADAHTGHWYGFAGSCARTWSSECSRPLEVVPFEGELKPLTPIETAPIGDQIGAIAYGFGRVVYTCGSNVHAFWPGRDDRVISLDGEIPADEWRLAIKGQNLFVVGKKKVKILSLQGWFALEQFSGEYLDQLLTETRWVGLRDDDGSGVLDFRDFRGGMAKEGVRLDEKTISVKLCASRTKIYAGGSDGQVKEVSEFGTELLGSGPEGGELLHLAATDDGPVAIYRSKGQLECWHFGEQTRWAALEVAELASNPILMGGKLIVADLANSELVTLNLKKMSVSRTKAFENVTSLRRLIGVQHRNHQVLLAVTCDAGKKSGRLVFIDAKTGAETTFGTVGQANVNLICADHHVVLATSSTYQNVIRVLEPFVVKVAA